MGRGVGEESRNYIIRRGEGQHVKLLSYKINFRTFYTD